MINLAFFIISLFILIHPTQQSADCNILTAIQALPPRIFFEQTIDGNDQNVYLTRFLHNKAGIFSAEFGKCYLNAFEPTFVYSAVGFFGLIFTVYFIFHTFDKKMWWVILLIFSIPVFAFFNFFTYLMPYTYKLYALIGLFIYRKAVR